MSDFHSINAEQGLYVLKCGDGFSCLGFDVAVKWSEGVHQWLASEGVTIPPPDASLRGTREGYEDHRRIMDAGNAHNLKTKHRCPAQLTPQLVGLEGKRVEVVDKTGEKRRFTVGKSCGWLPIHLEIARRNSSGGVGAWGWPFKSVRVVG